MNIIPFQEIIDLFNAKDYDSWHIVRKSIPDLILFYEHKIEYTSKSIEDIKDIRLATMKRSHIANLQHCVSILKAIKYDVNDKDKITSLSNNHIQIKPKNDKPKQGKLF